MEQQAFAAVEEATAEEVIVEESGRRVEQHVGSKGWQRQGGTAAAPGLLGAQGAVTIHVCDVGGEGGVSVVDQVSFQAAGFAHKVHRLVNWPGLKLGRAAAKEAQLGVGIKAAKTHPPSQEKVAAGERVAVQRGIVFQQLPDFPGQFITERFVGIERQHPIARTLFEGGVFLRSKAFPLFEKEASAVAAGDLFGAIARARIKYDNLVRPRYAAQRAREIGFFIFCDDGDGERVAHRRQWGVVGWVPRCCLMTRSTTTGRVSPVLGSTKFCAASDQSSLKLVESAEIQDLAGRGVGGDDKFSPRLVEQDIEHAILFFYFKADLFFFRDEVFL